MRDVSTSVNQQFSIESSFHTCFALTNPTLSLYSFLELNLQYLLLYFIIIIIIYYIICTFRYRRHTEVMLVLFVKV
jgi:hypothetical protein